MPGKGRLYVSNVLNQMHSLHRSELKLQSILFGFIDKSITKAIGYQKLWKNEVSTIHDFEKLYKKVIGFFLGQAFLPLKMGSTKLYNSM